MPLLLSPGRIALAAIAIRILAAPSFAEDFEARHLRDVSGNPSDLHFRLDTEGGRRTFNVGERIPIALSFSADSPDKYKLNGATYDRSGRLPTEEFVPDRNDLTDPYLDYFGTGVLGGLAGGLRGYPVLEPKPYQINLDLNDWFRFDRPGLYRFYVKSHRLTRERAPAETGRRTVDFAAVSNVMGIEIVEDAVWSAAKLDEIREVLDQPEPEQPKPGGPPVPYNPLTDKIAQARRELRYLATPGAVQLTFDSARRTGNRPDTLLLVGARDRTQMLGAFEEYLADPQAAFNEWDIRLRALFTFVQRDSPTPLPMFPWQFPAPSEWKAMQAAAEKRQKRFDQIVREEALRLIPRVARKLDRTREACGQAIASIAPDAARMAGLVPPDDYGLSREELIAGFATFPPARQSELLGRKWDLVRGPEMIPVLARLIGKAEPKPLPANALPLQLWGVDGGIADSALRRLAELSPQEAARILRSDIAGPHPRFPGFAAREFPAQNIPQADSALSAHLKTNLEGTLPLVAKFATPALAAEMRDYYRGRTGACAGEESFATYFVRTFPEADGEGRDVLSQAMADRQKRGCYRWLLNRVAAVVWNSAIQAQAIATLDDSDPQAAGSAAQVLAAHGDAGVEPLLWKRLEQWSERWRGRASELEIHPITGTLPNPESPLGSSLFAAIGTARSWILDEPRRRRLAALCIDEACRERWDRERPPGAIPLDISSGGGMFPAAFRVDGYTASTFDELKSKLLQFPAGTVFRWCSQDSNPFDWFSPGQREDMFRELAEFLAGRSRTVEPCAANR